MTLSRATLWVVLDKYNVPVGFATSEKNAADMVKDQNQWHPGESPFRYKQADLVWREDDDDAEAEADVNPTPGDTADGTAVAPDGGAKEAPEDPGAEPDQGQSG